MDESNKSEYLNGLLDIPELNVVDMEESPDTGDYVFHTTLKHPATNCPYCDSNKTVKCVYNKSISSGLFSNYSWFMTTSLFEPKLIYGSGANIEKLLYILEKKTDKE